MNFQESPDKETDRMIDNSIFTDIILGDFATTTLMYNDFFILCCFFNKSRLVYHFLFAHVLTILYFNENLHRLQHFISLPRLHISTNEIVEIDIQLKDSLTIF